MWAFLGRAATTGWRFLKTAQRARGAYDTTRHALGFNQHPQQQTPGQTGLESILSITGWVLPLLLTIAPLAIVVFLTFFIMLGIGSAFISVQQ